MNQWRFKLLYDGQCPMCRREANWLMRRNRAGQLAFEDISTPDFDASRYGLTQAQVMGVMHGVFPDGRIVTKVAAFREAYRQVGKPRLRDRQIGLILEVGHGLGAALRLPGIGMLLRMSRGPAHAAGLSELQGFLERGVVAFRQLGDVDAFLSEIQRSERAIAARLWAGDPDPFRE